MCGMKTDFSASRTAITPDKGDNPDTESGISWGLFDKYVVLAAFLLAPRVRPPPDEYDCLLELKWRFTEILIALLLLFIVKSYRPDWFECHAFVYLFVPEMSPVGVWDNASSSDSVTSATQTDKRDFKTEVQAFQTRHDNKMKQLSRSIIKLKRNFALKLKRSKELLKDRGECLAAIQLRLLPLAHQRETVLAEKDAIEKQLMEEKARYTDLLSRFNRVNEQMVKNGIQAAPGRYPGAWRPELLPQQRGNWVTST